MQKILPLVFSLVALTISSIYLINHYKKSTAQKEDAPGFKATPWRMVMSILLICFGLYTLYLVISSR